MSTTTELVQTPGINDIYHYNEIHLDSLRRDTGDNDHPGFTLLPAVQPVLGVKLLTAEIPLTYYTIPENTHFFYIVPRTPTEEDPSTETSRKIDIPTGNYDADSFAKLLTAMNIDGDLTWKYNFSTSKWEITHKNVAFTLHIPEDSSNPGAAAVAETLGFYINTRHTAVAAGSTGTTKILVSERVARLTGPPYLYLASDAIAARISSRIRCNGSNAPNPNIIAKIPITLPNGGIQLHRDYNLAFCFDAGMDTISYIDVYLVSPVTYLPIKLNGAGWSVTMAALTQRDTSVARNVLSGNEPPASVFNKRLRVR